MQKPGRTKRSTGIWSVVQTPPAWAGASRCVPKCSSVENFPIAKPSPVVPLRVNTFSPDQLGSVSARGWPRSSTRPTPWAARGSARRRPAGTTRADRMVTSETRLLRERLLVHPPAHGLQLLARARGDGPGQPDLERGGGQLLARSLRELARPLVQPLRPGQVVRGQ